MSSGNGNNTPPGIPPDVVWDEDNPPVIFSCSQHTEHDPDCDLKYCESEVATENQILLLNESKEWARQGLDRNSIQTSPFDTACQINALQLTLVEAGIVDQSAVDEHYRKIKADILKSVREEIGPKIKAARARAILGVDEHKRVIGPHGEIL